MITKVILMYLMIIGGFIFSAVMIIETVIGIINDIRGKEMNDYLELLQDKGLEVDIDKGTLFIYLDEKDYYSRQMRKNIQEIMKGYSKSYGIRLKGEGSSDDR